MKIKITQQEIDCKAKFLVEREVCYCVSALIDELMGNQTYVDELIEYESRIDDEGNQLEVFEYWIVSDWLADKLKARDEVVFEFFGLTIWGRTTTDQAIYCDYDIQEITKKLLLDIVENL